jgi:hypothetical protein
MLELSLTIAAVILILSGCASPRPPSAEIVGEWQGGWPGQVLTASAAEIGGQPYLLVMTQPSEGRPAKAMLRLLDLSDPGTPTEVGSLETPLEIVLSSGGLAVAGDRLYAVLMGMAKGALWVVDVSDPAWPREVALMETEYPVTRLVVAGDYAYLLTFGRGLVVTDISDPTSPQEAAYLGSVGGDAAKVSGPWLYTIGGGDGLHILDIASPPDVREVGFLADPEGKTDQPGQIPEGIKSMVDLGGFADVAVAGDYAYIPSRSSGLRVVDVSDPSSPGEIARVESGWSAWRALLLGDHLFLLSFYLVKGEAPGSRLEVLDISEPESPVVVDTVELDILPWPGPLVAAGSHLYVVTPGGMVVVDVAAFR